MDFDAGIGKITYRKGTGKFIMKGLSILFTNGNSKKLANLKMIIDNYIITAIYFSTVN